MGKANMIFPVPVIILAILALAAAPALAKDDKNTGSKKPKTQASAIATTTASSAHVSTPGQSPKMGHFDAKPGPAWKTVGGTVKSIHGGVYTVEDYDGNHIQLSIGQGTKHIRENKKIGDAVRAEITRDGFANSIQ